MVNCVSTLAIFAAFSLYLPVSYGFIEGIYCGTENCYDVLGVTRDSTKGEIAKAYRKLARKFHPDVYKGEDADKKFQLIASAYEVLKDDESRADYDYMLDNPEEVYRHYYHYYSRRVAPKVDVRIVIAVTITVISVLQYLHRWQRYYDAVNYALTVPKYRIKATQIAKDEGLLNGATKRSKTKKTKEELKEEEEAILRSIVENNVDIRGGYSKPSLWDVLWVQIVISPYTISRYIMWCMWWIWKFNIKREEYGPEETSYLTRKRLGMSENQWNATDEYDRGKLVERKLWIYKNFMDYKQEQEEEMRVQMAQNSRYKMYRRYMKTQGPGKISFAED